MPPQEKSVPESQKESTDKNDCSYSTASYTNKGFTGDSQKDSTKIDMSKNEKIGDESAFEFDDLLPHIGEFGIYQKLLFLMMIPFAFFVAWVYFTQIFITINPEEHWCRIPELENMTAEER